MRIRRVAAPPVDVINTFRLALEDAGARIINLGQAVPDLHPPFALGELERILGDPAIHGYTADAGLPELREAVAERLGSRSGVGTSMNRVLITGGANHAFAVICAALFDEGDRVGLLTPYFLNHRMAVEGCGAEVVEIDPRPDFAYEPGLLAWTVERAGLKAVVAVNPSNPTGKAFTRDELEGIAELCGRAGCWLLVDEVYSAFTYGTEHVSSVGLAGPNASVVTFGSFSKEFGLTGWRVGWIHAPAELMAELLKAQDYSLICAPHPSQCVALAALRAPPERTAEHRASYAERRDLVMRGLESSGLFEIYSGLGGFFVWFRPRRPINAGEEVLRIMERASVCLIPGGVFGTAWRGWLRLSYGSAGPPLLEVAVERLATYFHNGGAGVRERRRDS